MSVLGCKEVVMSVDKNVLENILVRSMGLLGKGKAEEVAKKAGIRLMPSGDIEVESSPDEVLENLIRNIVKEGGIIAKIAIKNMSRQYNFSMPQGL